ncbi:hypothetical protein VPH35_015281 [Triticum aestivum]
MSPPKVIAGPACVVGDEGRGEIFADSFPGKGPWTPRRRPRTARKRSSDVLAGFLGYTGGEDLADCGRNPDSPPSAPDLKTKKGLEDSIGMHTVQCYKCEKWRKIPTKKDSCIWVMDKAGIPCPPPVTERLVIMRRDLSKMDTYYLLPNGKRVRSGGDVEKFLQENPEYRVNLPASKFSFAMPKTVPATVVESSLRRVAKAEGKV